MRKQIHSESEVPYDFFLVHWMANPVGRRRPISKTNVLCLEVKLITNLLEGEVLPGVPFIIARVTSCLQNHRITYLSHGVTSAQTSRRHHIHCIGPTQPQKHAAYMQSLVEREHVGLESSPGWDYDFEKAQLLFCPQETEASSSGIEVGVVIAIIAGVLVVAIVLSLLLFRYGKQKGIMEQKLLQKEQSGDKAGVLGKAVGETEASV